MKRAAHPPEKKPPWVVLEAHHLERPLWEPAPRNRASAPSAPWQHRLWRHALPASPRDGGWEGGAHYCWEAQVSLMDNVPTTQGFSYPSNPPRSPPSFTDADQHCSLKTLRPLPALSPLHPSQGFPSVTWMPASTMMSVLQDLNECSPQVWEKHTPSDGQSKETVFLVTDAWAKEGHPVSPSKDHYMESPRSTYGRRQGC